MRNSKRSKHQRCKERRCKHATGCAYCEGVGKCLCGNGKYCAAMNTAAEIRKKKEKDRNRIMRQKAKR